MSKYPLSPPVLQIRELSRASWGRRRQGQGRRDASRPGASRPGLQLGLLPGRAALLPRAPLRPDVQPVRALLPEIALLLSAARFTPGNPTAGRACSGVTIKGQAVGGRKQGALFRMPTSLRFRFRSALGAHLSPSLGHPGALPGRQARSRGRLPSRGGSRPRLASGESGYLECQPASPGLGGGRKGWGAGSGGRWGDWVEKPETWEEGTRLLFFFRTPVMQAPVARGRNTPVTFVCLETKRERGCSPAPTCSCKYK